MQRYITILLASIVLMSAAPALGQDLVAQASRVKDPAGDSSQTDESLKAQIEERLRTDLPDRLGDD